MSSQEGATRHSISKLSVGVVPVVTTSASQAAQAIADIIYKMTIVASLDGVRANIGPYLTQGEFVAGEVSRPEVRDPSDFIVSNLTSIYEYVIDLLKAGVTSGSAGLFASVYESLTGCQYLLQAFHGSLYQIGVTPFIHRYFMTKYRPSIPDEDTLITLRRYNVITADKYAAYMAFHGYSVDFTNQLFLATQRPIDVARATESLWRGKLGVDAYKQILKENMIRDEHIDFLVDLTELIPPAPDLIQMVVREAFDPKQVVSAPEVFAEYMAKKGYKQPWPDRYWTAHFFRAAIGRIEDRYCRGALTESGLRAWYTLADIHPGDHDHLLGTIYSAPTRIDARFGYATGVYAHDDLVRFNRMRRMSPSDADTSARAQELYLLRDEVTRMASAAETDFLDDVLTEDELRANLEALRFSAEEVEYRVTLALHKKAMALRRIPRTTQKNVLVDEINRLASAAQKDFEDDVIDEAVLRADLTALQFTAEEIEYRVSLGLHNRFTSLRRLNMDALKTQFLYAKIDENTFRSEMIALGVSAERVDAIIREMLPRRKTVKTDVVVEKKKKLTEAKIASARDLGLISDTEYISRLTEIDYTPEDAALLLSIELTPKPVTAEELDRRRRSIESRLNRARRRYDLELTKFSAEITQVDKDRADLDYVTKESLDIIDVQVGILEREIRDLTPDDVIIQIYRRPMTRVEISRLSAAEVTRRIYDEGLVKPEISALIPDPVKTRLNNWRVLRERREYAIATYDKRSSDLVKRKQDLLETRSMIEAQRDDEIAEYENELKLLVGG